MGAVRSSKLLPIAEFMFHTLQFVVEVRRRLAPMFVERAVSHRQTNESSDQVPGWYSVPFAVADGQISTRSNGVESWPSATANGTE